MIGEHRYILEKKSKKHNCPECSKNRFVRYVDAETGDYLPGQYGRCDREVKCAYHLNPYLNGYAKTIKEQEGNSRAGIPKYWKPQSNTKNPQPLHKPVFIPDEVLKQTLQPERYEQNVFLQNLLTRISFPFEVKDIEKVISLYYLGSVSSGYRTGAVTFPFIDINGNIRAIQVKQFNKANHTTGTDFLHSIIEKHHTRYNKSLPKWLKTYLNQDKKVSCLFGEHLLQKHPHNPVALVEAPKTAVYGTLYFGFPEIIKNFIWLAVYNKSSFSFDKLKVLQGREIYTFPDLSINSITFKEWENKARDFEKRLPGTRFVFSNLLELLAPETDKYEGKDLADYLITLDWKLFRKSSVSVKDNIKPQPEPVASDSTTREKCEGLNKPFFSLVGASENVDVSNPYLPDTCKNKQAESWNKEITELEDFFTGIKLPDEPLKLNPYSTIVNLPVFIESHLTIVKANNGKQTFLPYLNRLQKLKQSLTVK